VQPVKQFSPRRLRELRKQHGFSQQLLSTAIGASINALAGWEQARCQPQVHHLGRLARELDCSIDELFEESDDA
jgi:transcriptional regulator with XRE-family HTH domain